MLSDSVRGTSPADVLLSLADGYASGIKARFDVSRRMKGSIITWPHGCGVIYQCIQNCDGHHLDIGTAGGGTAFVSHKAIKDGRRVYTVDPFEGKYKDYKEIWIENQAKLGPDILWVPNLDDLLDARFATAYIDGDHAFESIWRDWNFCISKVDNYIILDDVCRKFPGVLSVFDILSRGGTNWRLVHLAGITAVFAKEPLTN